MKIGFTCSTFDLLHCGHISMLKEAKEQCDYLICGLHIDPSIERVNKNSPIQSVEERYIQLSAVKYVDEIIPYSTKKDLTDILKMYRIDVRILGKEYAHGNFTGHDICNELGVELYFNNREHDFSSTELRKRLINEV